MILPGSYANGFAPRDGQPLFPELWRACVGAWNPSLGCTGTTLRDWSGYSRHGTLQSGPTWSRISGYQSLSFDGVNDYVSSSFVVDGSSSITLAGWIRFDVAPSAVTSNPILNAGGNLTANPGIQFRTTSATTLQLLARSASATNAISVTIAAGQTVFVCGVLDREKGLLRCVLNRTETSTALTVGTFTSTQQFEVGRGLDSGIPSVTYSTVSVSDVRIYSRGLSSQEINTLSSRPGIAYEMTPRRRSSVAVAAFNRRRRLLLGAQS